MTLGETAARPRFRPFSFSAAFTSGLVAVAENVTAIQGLKPLDPVPVTPELKAWPPGS